MKIERSNTAFEQTSIKKIYWNKFSKTKALITKEGIDVEYSVSILLTTDKDCLRKQLIFIIIPTLVPKLFIIKPTHFVRQSEKDI